MHYSALSETKVICRPCRLGACTVGHANFNLYHSMHGHLSKMEQICCCCNCPCCRDYSMWFSVSTSQDPNPIPESITPMWDQNGSLTHYTLMFGLPYWKDRNYTNGQTSKSLSSISRYVTVVPADITLLTYLRFEFAADADKLRCSCTADQHSENFNPAEASG